MSRKEIEDLPKRIKIPNSDEVWVLRLMDCQTGDTYEPTSDNLENHWLLSEPIYKPE